MSVAYFVYTGIAITVLLGILGELEIRKKKRKDKGRDGDKSK